MFFDDILKIFLIIWYKMWSIRQFKLFILCRRWYLKFIIFVWLFWSFSVNWSISSLRCNVRIIIDQSDNFFSWFVKCFNIFYCVFFYSDLYRPYKILFRFDLNYFFLFLVLYNHFLFFYQKLVDLQNQWNLFDYFHP